MGIFLAGIHEIYEKKSADVITTCRIGARVFVAVSHKKSTCGVVGLFLCVVWGFLIRRGNALYFSEYKHVRLNAAFIARTLGLQQGTQGLYCQITRAKGSAWR